MKLIFQQLIKSVSKDSYNVTEDSISNKILFLFIKESKKCITVSTKIYSDSTTVFNIDNINQKSFSSSKSAY